jgi:leucyl/phenylalanyl-tRNA--protein transferase
MSKLRWLSAADGPAAFPDPAQALREPNGLLAAGGALEPDWLLGAYARGIFPWFEAGQPILWWSPDPRIVLAPDGLKVTRSLRKRLRRGDYEITADREFDAVIDGCARPRRYTDATWITPPMAAAYSRLHGLGWAHSFEAWAGSELAGGLYGVAIGKVFFGESMFADRPDASKVAFYHALAFLRERCFEIVDCQLPSAHLSRLGAKPIPRAGFLSRLAQLCEPAGEPAPWTALFGTRSGE